MTSTTLGYIMVVEDDAEIRDALCAILEDEGYAVRAAAHGRDALDRMDVAPALILLDLMMPVMNGWQFRAEQRQRPALAQVPVVIISADGNIAEKAASLGANGYLRKPIHLDDLLATIHRFA